MKPSDQADRLERMKKVLADSFPQVAEERRQEPLPESVRAELAGRARSEPAKTPWLETLLSWLRGPQLVALGAAAVVVIVAFVALGPDVDDNGGQPMRSGGGVAGEPPVIVLHGLTEEQTEALRDSGYFRPEQLLVILSGADATDFLQENRQPNLVLVDAATGEISAPFAGDDGPGPLLFEPGEQDLAPLLLDMLVDLPEPDTAE